MSIICRKHLMTFHRFISPLVTSRAIIGASVDCKILQCQKYRIFEQMFQRNLSGSTEYSQTPAEDNSTSHHHTSGSVNSSIDDEEVDKFSRIAESWWDPSGEFQALHNMNELRVPLIRDGLMQESVTAPETVTQPLTGMRILDVGCGGGILSEPLARLGADVLGIDASAENITMATWHGKMDSCLTEHLRYRCCPVEDLANEETASYDGVVASEILEHVSNPQDFLNACGGLVKPGGSVFITTLNKTWLSYVLGVIAAEKILRIVPDGAHDWDKFVAPSTVQTWLTQSGFHTILLHGMTMNPISQRWYWIRDKSINYAIHAVKLKQ